MSSVRSICRHLLLAVAAALVLMGTSILAAAPAQAVNYEGVLSLKGAGTTYHSLSPVIVARAGASGQTLTYGVQVYNAGATETQYALYLQQSGLSAESGSTRAACSVGSRTTGRS